MPQLPVIKQEVSSNLRNSGLSTAQYVRLRYAKYDESDILLTVEITREKSQAVTNVRRILEKKVLQPIEDHHLLWERYGRTNVRPVRIQRKLMRQQVFHYILRKRPQGIKLSNLDVPLKHQG